MNIYDLKGNQYINVAEITAKVLRDEIIYLDNLISRLNDEINELKLINNKSLENQKKLEMLLSYDEYYTDLFYSAMDNARNQMEDLELTNDAMLALIERNGNERIPKSYIPKKANKPVDKDFIKKVRLELIKIMPKEIISKSQFLLYFKQAVINSTEVDDEIVYPSSKSAASYLVKTKKIMTSYNCYQLNEHKRY